MVLYDEMRNISKRGILHFKIPLTQKKQRKKTKKEDKRKCYNNYSQLI